jgi:thiol:disulfide interchange protein DsbD
VWTADVPLSPDRAGSPAQMPLVLVADNGQGWRADAAVGGTWPAPAPAAGVSPALEAALAANAARGVPGGAPAAPRSAPSAVPVATFAWALLGALVGGMLLNLMPCVFPVLAIKVLGFARHGDDRRAHRISGLAYSAGVVLSFVALGALMLALRAAGEQLGWGFQLQSPLVVALLGTLFAVLGLNLAGCSSSAASCPAAWPRCRRAIRWSTPGCRACWRWPWPRPARRPSWGPRWGWPWGCRRRRRWRCLPPWGWAWRCPTWRPAGCRRWRALPRPGAWMDVFKKFMAFPMFGTAVWLLWVLGQQSGIDGAGALLALWVALALLLWALGLAGRALGDRVAGAGLHRLPGPGHRPQRAARRRLSRRSRRRAGPGRGGRGALAALVARARAGAAGRGPAGVRRLHRRLVRDLPVQQEDHAGQRRGAGRHGRRPRADPARRLDAARCGHQRRAARLGRSGVPVYVLLAPGQAPVVFSEVLSAADVKGALAALKS